MVACVVCRRDERITSLLLSLSQKEKNEEKVLRNGSKRGSSSVSHKNKGHQHSNVIQSERKEPHLKFPSIHPQPTEGMNQVPMDFTFFSNSGPREKVKGQTPRTFTKCGCLDVKLRKCV